MFLLAALMLSVSTNEARARTAPSSATLDKISRLAQAGAPQLAIKMLHRAQPAFQNNSVTWLQWERERVHIYQSAKSWQALGERVHHLPPGLPKNFLAWELLQAGEADLELGKARAARRLMRRLISSAGQHSSNGDLKRARELIIKSYIAAHRFKDALSAVHRFNHDYPGAMREQEARVLLQLRRPAAALTVLQGAQSTQAGLLRLLAKLRVAKINAAEIGQRARRLATNAHNSRQFRTKAWLLAAAAATRQKKPAARVTSLEHVLTLASPDASSASVWAVSPDVLWSAYLKLGANIAAKLELKANDFAAMFLDASNRFHSDPLQARALLAVVALHAVIPRQRAVAHGQLAALLDKRAGGGRVLAQLYLHSRRFKKITAVPADVRYILVKYAVAASDTDLAARLVRGLSQPPPNSKASVWTLQRVRIFMRAGQAQAAIAVLARLLTGSAKVSSEQVLPLLFDLQAAGRDRAAIRFFKRLLRASKTAEQRRHLLYWMGESYASLDKYARAARLYLTSAIVKDPFAMDQWAQSARFKAAQMLARAGLRKDARRQYQKLLNASDDPSRRAVLQHHIEQLKLRHAHTRG